MRCGRCGIGNPADKPTMRLFSRARDDLPSLFIRRGAAQHQPRACWKRIPRISPIRPAMGVHSHPVLRMRRSPTLLVAALARHDERLDPGDHDQSARRGPYPGNARRCPLPMQAHARSTGMHARTMTTINVIIKADMNTHIETRRNTAERALVNLGRVLNHDWGGPYARHFLESVGVDESVIQRVITQEAAFADR